MQRGHKLLEDLVGTQAQVGGADDRVVDCAQRGEALHLLIEPALRLLSCSDIVQSGGRAERLPGGSLNREHGQEDIDGASEAVLRQSLLLPCRREKLPGVLRRMT